LGPSLSQTGCSNNEATARQIARNTNANASEAGANAWISDSWDCIKSYTYEKRVEFTAAFNRIEGKNR